MWNYRLVRTTENGEPLCRMQEVYYDGRGRPYAHCDASIQGQTPEECMQDVAWIMVGLTKPVLDYPKDFTGKAPGEKRARRR